MIYDLEGTVLIAQGGEGVETRGERGWRPGVRGGEAQG